MAKEVAAVGKKAEKADSRRVVVKIGTSLIADAEGRLDRAEMSSIVRQMAQLHGEGHEVLLVTSGAIAAGVEALGLPARPSAIPELQAVASVGQGRLVNRYSELFAEHNVVVGQVLITQFETTHRRQYLNARHTFETLLKFGAVPIINENDTTAVEEIRFGDNDTLAALVAHLVKADLLILLTDTEGLYTADPQEDRGAELLRRVERVTPEMEAAAGGKGTRFATGGMTTKLQAAQIVTFAGIGMYIAPGRRAGVLADIMAAREVGTYFVPRKKRIPARKLWIAFGRKPAGRLVVDDGAARAVTKSGKSLLPAGVTASHGTYEVGDALTVEDSRGREIARGLTNFSAAEVNKIAGLRSDEVAEVLPDAAGDEVIHRDCLVVLEE